jgi:hypothetical protein
MRVPAWAGVIREQSVPEHQVTAAGRATISQEFIPKPYSSIRSHRFPPRELTVRMEGQNRADEQKESVRTGARRLPFHTLRRTLDGHPVSAFEPSPP